MGYFDIPELDQYVEENPQLKERIPYVFRLRLSDLKFLTIFIFVIYFIPDLLLSYLCGMPIEYFLLNIFPIHISAYIIGVIFIVGLRSSLVTFLEIIGAKRGPRRHPSLGYIYYNQERFKKFSKEALDYVFFPRDKDKLSIVIGLLLYLFLIIPTAISVERDPIGVLIFLLTDYGLNRVYPWSVIGSLFIKSVWGYISISLVSFGLTMLRSIKVMNNATRDYKNYTIFKIVEWLNLMRLNHGGIPKDVKEELSRTLYERGHYTIFYYVANTIVNFYMKISLIVFILGISYGLGNLYVALVIPLSYTRVYLGLILGLIIVVVGLFIFFYPQSRLHSLMKGYKESILYTLKGIYESLMFKYINEQDENVKKVLENDIIVARRAIEYNSNLKTWPFDMNQAIKIFGGVFIAIESAILQLLITLS